jgi:hypothetical protein
MKRQEGNMSDAEVSEIAGFLLDCSRAVRECGDTPEIMVYLHRLWQIVASLQVWIDPARCDGGSMRQRQYSVPQTPDWD